MASRTAIVDYVPYLIGALGVATLVFVASLFGILTRPEGLLAVLWPANALLLAAFVRVPTMNTPIGWFAAFGGYMLADLMTGSDPNKAMWLTFANMAGVAAGLVLIRRLGPDDRNMRRPAAILYLCLVGGAAAITSGLMGILVAIIVFQSNPAMAFLFWTTTEFANYVVILPFALTALRWSSMMQVMQATYDEFQENWKAARAGLPFFSLIVSMILVGVIEGPSAIVYPVPALLWCALSYRLHFVALLIMLMSMWMMIELELDLLANLPEGADPYYGVMSTRMGIAMLALGPLTVASTDRARAALVERLDHAANHDFLTGVLTRGALMPLGQEMVDHVVAQKGRLTIMVMDLDHFKDINDTYGHAAGDRILVEVSRVIQRNLRGSDLFARLGGEEFAVLVPGIAHVDAQGLAQRIRKAVETASIAAPDETRIHTTVSIGLLCRDLEKPVSLDGLVNEADKAMYDAKRAGRNRVVER
ncbi:MAG: diguanylate cyclase [Thalassospira sp.]|uniref:GGDEF domain-containing protein n=1 Tax=Thalassospira sp. TaxID=1912094 RepID=UPI003A8776DA